MCLVASRPFVRPKQVFQQFKYLAQRVVRQDRVLTKGKSGAWLGVNGDKRAAEQETTTVSRACGLVLMGVKSSARQTTTTVNSASS